jgi:poly-gamma-glutamate synthesis protein (capsule biosynthesis protein)
MTRSTATICLLMLLIIASCTSSPVSSDAGRSITATPTAENELLGRVVDDQGSPVQNANIKSDSEITLTDDDGWFHMPSNGYAQWVTVYKPGYISRTRAASPGTPVLIRVSPDDGQTIVLKFAGDVMFGRRFFDMNSDGDTEDGLLPVNPSVVDHVNLLEPITPLLKDSDITVVNLETTLDPQPYFSPGDPRPAAFHPTKDYIYATHPNAVAALLKSGVNLIGLGNDHVYDTLEPGMVSLEEYLTHLGMPHFGAGMNEDEAWEPAFIEIKGQTIAFIGCTTIFASGGVAEPGEITYVASDDQAKGGAAYCERDRLSMTVADAKKKSDLVIVMIHGGVEYNRKTPAGPLRFSEIAKQAGATIVVNHHPHVVSGFSWEDEKIIARSLGNFIFDQTIWPSLESYLLTIYVRDGKVTRAFIEPVLLHENIARGITDDLADYVARDAAGLESGPFILESDTMEVDINRASRQVSKSVILDGGSGTLVQIPNGQWLSAFKGSGELMVGRDLLWVGGFENNMVDEIPGFLPLWEQANMPGHAVGPEFSYQGQSGLRLIRMDTNKHDIISSNLHRIPMSAGSRITIAGMFRASSDAKPSVQVNWYSDTAGPFHSQIVEPLIADTAGAWQYFQLDLEVPANTAAMKTFLKLSPPTTGTVTVDFDNIRIIEWASGDKLEFSPLYNFAYLTGQGKLTFTQSVLPGGEDWLTVLDTDISKYTFKRTP